MCYQQSYSDIVLSLSLVRVGEKKKHTNTTKFEPVHTPFSTKRPRLLKQVHSLCNRNVASYQQDVRDQCESSRSRCLSYRAERGVLIFSFNAANINTSSLGCSAHLGHGSRQGEKRLLLQEGFIHGGHVGLHMELIGFALCSLRLAQPEVVVRRPVVGDAEAHEKNEKHTTKRHIEGSSATSRGKTTESSPPTGRKQLSPTRRCRMQPLAGQRAIVVANKGGCIKVSIPAGQHAIATEKRPHTPNGTPLTVGTQPSAHSTLALLVYWWSQQESVYVSGGC